MDDRVEERRTEQNLIVRSGKSEVEVTNNRRLRRSARRVVLFVQQWYVHQL